MPDQAIINVTDALLFANVLEAQSRDVAGKTAAIKGKLTSLHSTWKGAKYDHFQHLFEEATKDLEMFTKRADNYARYLRAKAGKAREYLEHRL